MTTPATATPVEAPPDQVGAGLATTPSPRPTMPAPVYGTSTPRLLRIIRNVVIAALLVFAGLTVVGTVVPEVALGAAESEVTYGMQLRNARATLAEADRRASVAFLDPTAAAANGEWTAYVATLDQVSSMLVTAAAQHPDDAEQLATAQTQVSEYRRAVDAARAVSTSDATAAGSQFSATSATLATPMATLAELAQASDGRVDRGLAWSLGIWAVVAAWVALGVLVVSSVLIARRTRRVLNPGLVLAVVVVGVALGLVSQVQDTVQQSVTQIRTSSLTAARIHADTRALAEQAKAAEGRSLLASGSGSATYSQVTADLTVALATLPSDSERTSQRALWDAYQSAHQALPTAVVDAKAQARTTTLTALTAFVDAARKLADANASDARITLSGAREGQLPLGIIASLLGLLAIVAALWGITRRLSEYV